MHERSIPLWSLECRLLADGTRTPSCMFAIARMPLTSTLFWSGIGSCFMLRHLQRLRCPKTVIHTQSICSGRRPSKARTVNDSTVGEAWKEYVFSVREEVSTLLRTIQPHSTKGNLCEEHLEVWQMHAKNWCRLSGNSPSFKSASTQCE